MTAPDELERLAKAVIDAETETAFNYAREAFLERLAKAVIGAETETAHYAREAFAEAAPHILKALSERAELLATVERMRGALEPLKNIADAYDDNSLDDEARKYWGRNREHYNERPADQIELYTGRGGSRLLTLADCFAARAALTTGEEK